MKVGGGWKTIVIFVPIPQLKSFQKIQVQLVCELEKKFSRKQVVFITQRRILPKPTRISLMKTKQKHPGAALWSLCMTTSWRDLVFPSEIVGKRICKKLDSSLLIKVHLDKAQQNNMGTVRNISGVYKNSTGKDVNFEFHRVSVVNRND